MNYSKETASDALMVTPNEEYLHVQMQKNHLNVTKQQLSFYCNLSLTE